MEDAVWIAIAFAFGLDISFVWGRKSLRTAECVCGWSGVAVPPSHEKFVGLGGVWVGVSFLLSEDPGGRGRRSGVCCFVWVLAWL